MGMKIFLGCKEQASILSSLSLGLEKNGHLVTTLIVENNHFYESTFDHNLDTKASRMLELLAFIRPQNSSLWLYKYLKKLLVYFYALLLLPRLIVSNDIFIFLWKTLLPFELDLFILKLFRKKIITIFVGSEIRTSEGFSQEFKVNVDAWDTKYKGGFNNKFWLLRIHELLSDAIFSVPDQSSLAIRPYHHLYLPFDDGGFVYKNHKRLIPKIVHVPSNSSIKGSKEIIRTLDKLREEGIEFEFRTIENVPNQTVKEILTDADILVDELVLHGPGTLSLEAMASGCAAATKFLDQYSNIFNPPVCSINSNTIYPQLKRLIIDLAYRNELIEKGQPYVKEFHSAETISKNILEKLSTASFSYWPTFFIMSFKFPLNIQLTFWSNWINRIIINRYKSSEKITLHVKQEG